MEETEHRGYYTRGYLPHIDDPDRAQMVTYRLDDALPLEVRRRIDASSESTSPATEKLLDAGYGVCWLERDDIAEIVADNLRFHDGDKYRLEDWVVMPNHVHVSYDKPQTRLADIVHGWKSYTANRITRAVDDFGGDRLWQRGYFDRYIRDKYHFFNVRCYIILNPVKAGLVNDPFEWPHSSIHHYDGMEDAFRRWFRRWKESFWKSC